MFTDRVCSWQNRVEDDHDGGPEDGDLQTVNLCSGGVKRIYLTIILTSPRYSSSGSPDTPRVTQVPMKMTQLL